MGIYLDQVPAEIQSHLRQITKTSGLPDTEDSVELIAQGWLEKKELFEKQVGEMQMEDVELLERQEERGCLAMTYSGSLLNIGPLRGGGAQGGVRGDRAAPGRARGRGQGRLAAWPRPGGRRRRGVLPWARSRAPRRSSRSPRPTRS